LLTLRRVLLIYILNPTSIAKANMKDNAFHLLTAAVNAYNPDVVIITESWLKKENTLMT
jgi:hypothetical protein